MHNRWTVTIIINAQNLKFKKLLEFEKKKIYCGQYLGKEKQTRLQ